MPDENLLEGQSVGALRAFVKLRTELDKDEKSVKSIILALNKLGETLNKEKIGADTAVKAIDKVATRYGIDLPATMERGLDSMLIDTGNFVERMTYAERERYVAQLENHEKMMQEDKNYNSSMLKAYIRKNKFELQMEKIKLEQMKASQQGFIAKMKVNYKELQANIANWAQDTFGVSSDLTKSIIDQSGKIAILGMGITAASIALKTTAEQFEAANESILKLGGPGATLSQMIGQAGAINKALEEQTMSYGALAPTLAQQIELFKEATKSGLTSIAVTRQGFDYANMNQKSQAAVAKQAYKTSLELKWLSQTLFEGENMLGRYSNILKKYHKLGLQEGLNLMTVVGRVAASFGVTSNFMIEVIDVLGESALMSGQSIYESIGYIMEFGKSMRSIRQSVSGPELEEAYQSLVQMAKGFDNFRYMAVSGATDLIQGYTEAVSKSDIGKMAIYLQGLAKELGVESEADRAKALAIAYEPLRNMGAAGIEMAKAILKMKPGGTEEEWEEAAKKSGLTKAQIEAGKQLDFMKDPLARLADIVNKLAIFIFNAGMALLPGMLRLFRVKLTPEAQAQLDDLKKLSSQFTPDKSKNAAMYR